MEYRNPLPTVDVLIYQNDRILLIKRKNPPFGWALPGGFIDAGEKAEQAAIREAREETSLEVRLERLFSVYSDPNRDVRFHTLSIVYIASATGTPDAKDDATEVSFFSLQDLPKEIAFDHQQILEDFKTYLKNGSLPAPQP